MSILRDPAAFARDLIAMQGPHATRTQIIREFREGSAKWPHAPGAAWVEAVCEAVAALVPLRWE